MVGFQFFVFSKELKTNPFLANLRLKSNLPSLLQADSNCISLDKFELTTIAIQCCPTVITLLLNLAFQTVKMSFSPSYCVHS